MEKDKFTGMGSHTFSNGSSYEGEWVNGAMEGQGTMRFANYDLYEGEWKAGKPDGIGTFSFYDVKRDKYTSKYVGHFAHGVREGAGRQLYSDGTFYDGQWQNDMADGSCFHGLWKFDEMLRGVYSLTSGDKYDGEIKKGRFEGYGKYFWKSGNWFEGIFEGGKPKTGIFFSPDGKMTEIKEGETV